VMAGERMGSRQLHREHDDAQQQITPAPTDRGHRVAAGSVAHALTITRIPTPVVGRRE
jgi:hypothetical protein